MHKLTARSLFKRRDQLRKDMAAANKEVRRAEDRAARLEAKLRIANRVTEIWGGIAVSVSAGTNCYGRYLKATEIRDDGGWGNGAEVYPFAHTSENGKAKEWNVKVCEPGGLAISRDRVAVWHLADFDEGVKLVREWLCEGTCGGKTFEQF